MNVRVQQLVALVQTVNASDVLKTKVVRVPYVDALTDEKNVHVLQLDVAVRTVSVSDVLKISNHYGYTRTMGYLLSTNS